MVREILSQIDICTDNKHHTQKKNPNPFAVSVRFESAPRKHHYTEGLCSQTITMRQLTAFRLSPLRRRILSYCLTPQRAAVTGALTPLSVCGLASVANRYYLMKQYGQHAPMSTWPLTSSMNRQSTLRHRSNQQRPFHLVTLGMSEKQGPRAPPPPNADENNDYLAYALPFILPTFLWLHSKFNLYQGTPHSVLVLLTN